MTSVTNLTEAKASAGTAKRKFQQLQPTQFTSNKSFKLDTDADKENVLPNLLKSSGPMLLKKPPTMTQKPILKLQKPTVTDTKSRDVLKRPTLTTQTAKSEKELVSTRLLSKLPLGTSGLHVASSKTKLTVFEDDAVPEKKSTLVTKRNPLAPVTTNKKALAPISKAKAPPKPAPKKTDTIIIHEDKEGERDVVPLAKSQQQKAVIVHGDQENDTRARGEELKCIKETKVIEQVKSAKVAEKEVIVLESSDFELSLDEDESEEEIEDIDITDKYDPQQCWEYVEDIFQYLKMKETKYRPRSDYLPKQKEINEKMREVLVDWLIEVATKFRLLPESLFLGVALMDVFFSKKQVGRAKMQLVGIGALLIASKFEEVSCPLIDDYVWIAADSYTREEIIKAEKVILETLGFDLSVQTPIHFLRRFSKAARSNTKTHTLCKYLIEMSLMNYSLLQFLPSMIAASSVYLARKMMDIEPAWTPTLIHYTSYTEEALQPCVRQMNKYLHTTYTSDKTRTVVMKYSKNSMLGVATIAPVTL